MANFYFSSIEPAHKHKVAKQKVMVQQFCMTTAYSMFFENLKIREVLPVEQKRRFFQKFENTSPFKILFGEEKYLFQFLNRI